MIIIQESCYLEQITRKCVLNFNNKFDKLRWIPVWKLIFTQQVLSFNSNFWEECQWVHGVKNRGY